MMICTKIVDIEEDYQKINSMFGVNIQHGANSQ